MKKIIILLFLFYTVIVSTACTKKEIYLTPEITGYLYDSSTKKPLNSKVGLIGFNGLTPSDAPDVTLNSDGSFILKPITKTYYLVKPNLQKYAQMPSSIYISFNGFNAKEVDLSNEKFHKISSNNEDFRYYRKINLGIIYIDPQNITVNNP